MPILPIWAFLSPQGSMYQMEIGRREEPLEWLRIDFIFRKKVFYQRLTEFY